MAKKIYTKKKKQEIEKTAENRRGRPKKEFVLKPKKVKRAGPGRPKKEIFQEKRTMFSLPSFRSHKIQTPPQKDIVIFLVFLISLGLFVFSLYITYSEKKNTSWEIAVEIPNNKTVQETLLQTGRTETTNTNQIISQRYTAINKQDRNTAYTLIDPKLKQSSIFRTYFTQKRLNRFITNLNTNKIQITQLQNTETNSGVYIYTITYTLNSQETFSETRNATIINKEGSEKIASLRCITSGCSRMPFFNPAKYQIK